MADAAPLLMEKDGSIGWLIFNRPDKRNAVGIETWQLMPDYTRVAFGPAAQLVDRLKELQEQLGLDGISVEPNSASLIPPEYVTRSLRIVAHDVIPAFK